MDVGDWFGFRVAIYVNNSVIGSSGDDIERGSNSGSGYMYTNIGGK